MEWVLKKSIKTLVGVYLGLSAFRLYAIYKLTNVSEGDDFKPLMEKLASLLEAIPFLIG